MWFDFSSKLGILLLYNRFKINPCGEEHDLWEKGNKDKRNILKVIIVHAPTPAILAQIFIDDLMAWSPNLR